MLKTNARRLVEKAVAGTVSQPMMPLKNPWIVDTAGTARVLPGTGGITYNVAVGDSALEFAGDHVEPCVSVSGSGGDGDRSGAGALGILSCVGNEATVVDGRAEGAKGTVTGKHGGVEHVLVDFPPAALEKLSIGDKIQIRTVGQGLAFDGFPDVHVMNLSPLLAGRLGIEVRGGRLIVPVAHVVPSSIMGSGIGSRHSYSGDYDMQLADPGMIDELGLGDLRIGDLIAITGADCRYGRSVRAGAVTVGVVVHGSCLTGGHGPGVTALMTTAGGTIVPARNDGANLGAILGIGRARRPAGSRRGRAKPRSQGG